MDSSIFIPILFVSVAIIIGVSIYYFSNKQVIIRTLKKLPNKPIGGLKTNQFTKVTGKALHVKEPLIAPYSKRKCIFYVIKIEQKKSNGKNSHWRTLVDEEKIQEFFIEKSGDFVIVKPSMNPKNYKSHLVVDNNASSGSFNDASPKFEALLKHYDIDSTGFLGFNKQLRYSEGIIEVGEEITVAGIAKWKTLNQPIEGYSYSKIAALESTDKQKIIITDLPNVNPRRRRI